MDDDDLEQEDRTKQWLI